MFVLQINVGETQEYNRYGGGSQAGIVQRATYDGGLKALWQFSGFACKFWEVLTCMREWNMQDVTFASSGLTGEHKNLNLQ